MCIYIYYIYISFFCINVHSNNLYPFIIRWLAESESVQETSIAARLVVVAAAPMAMAKASGGAEQNGPHQKGLTWDFGASWWCRYVLLPLSKPKIFKPIQKLRFWGKKFLCAHILLRFHCTLWHRHTNLDWSCCVKVPKSSESQLWGFWVAWDLKPLDAMEPFLQPCNRTLPLIGRRIATFGRSSNQLRIQGFEDVV